MAHSPVGASSCERWWNCPGSNSLIATQPPADTSIYAAEGTAAHELAEQMLKLVLCAPGNKYPVGDGMIGETKEVDGFNIKITEDMNEAVKLYVETIISDAVENGCTLRNASPNGHLHDKKDIDRVYSPWLNIEKQFHLKDVDEEAFGTNDASLIRPGEKLIVYDFKYGRGIPVEAVENKQLLYYAAGVAGDDLLSFKTVELVIIQPRAAHPEGPIRRWSTTPEYVLEFKNELKKRIQATREKDAPLSAGKWCKFCNAKLVCPAMKDKIADTARMDFGLVPARNVLPKPEQLTPEQLRVFLDNAELLEDFIKSVREYAFGFANRGGNIPGYKLVHSDNTRRKWIDEKRAAVMLELEFGEDKVYEVKLKSPAQVEKISKAAKARVAELCCKPEGKLTLVRDTDVREGQTARALSDFQNIDIDLEV